MRVTYMISLNHDVPAQSITKLHAYKFAANPRNPAQTRTFPRNATRKFGLAAAAAFGASVRAAEEPPHTVLLSDGNFEIRDYPSLTIAEVTVRANRNDAAYAGFRKLAGFIFGG